jgi:membrane protease YdiL (CAAX protease family)
MHAGFHPVLFYSLSVAIAWTAWAPLVAHVRGMVALPVPYPVALFICQTLGAFAPLLALLLIQRLKGEPGLVEGVLRKIRLRNAAWRWLILSAVLPSAIAMITSVAYGLFRSNGEIAILRPEPVAELGWALVLVIPLTFVLALVGSPLGEEPGWRGYVFDQFVQRSQGYFGSAVVALMWWVWHVPLFIVLGVAPNGYSLLEMVGFSLLIDSCYLLSGRNLLAAMFAHQGANIGFMFFAGKTKSVVGLAILLGIAIALRVWAGWQDDRSEPPTEPRAGGVVDT